MSFLDPDFERAFGPTNKIFPGQSLKDAQIFLTGGTGFFGAWTIESYLWLKKNYDLGDSKLTILSRNPTAFTSRFPELTSRFKDIEFVQGDVCDFRFPKEAFTHIVHAATPVADKNITNDELLKVIDQGTARVLEFAKIKGISNLLLTSSGAVYGTQPQNLKLIPESHSTDSSNGVSTYGKGKRLAEARCLKTHQETRLNAVIARCFAFMGPYLPLESSLAVACFTRDAIEKKPIKITGNSETTRSYLYGADLSAWLWNLLLRGLPAHPYNVGSERAFSLLNVAKEFARQAGTSVEILSSSPGTADRYVPSVSSASSALGLQETFDLESAIERTLKWNREKTSHV